MNRKSEKGQVIVVIAIILFLIAIALALLGSGATEKDKTIAQQQATITTQARTISSYFVVLLNVLDVNKGVFVEAWPVTADDRNTAAPGESKPCLHVNFEDWATAPAAVVRSTPVPTGGIDTAKLMAPQSFSGLLCPPAGWRLYTFLVVADQIRPTIGGMIHGNKILWNVHGVQGYGCPETVKRDPSDPYDAKCLAAGQALQGEKAFLVNPTYDVKRSVLWLTSPPGIQTDGRTVEACDYQRKMTEAGQMLYELNCVPGYEQKGSITLVGPGIGQANKTRFFIGHDGSGPNILPFEDKYWSLRPIGLPEPPK